MAEEKLDGLPIKDPALFFVCRFCVVMAEQWDRGERVCHRQCGGPRKGRTFPLYRGPMTEDYLRWHCFVCGNSAERYIKVSSGTRELGICVKHFPFAGIPPEAEQKPEDAGVITKIEKKIVPINEVLGIDPKDLTPPKGT